MASFEYSRKTATLPNILVKNSKTPITPPKKPVNLQGRERSRYVRYPVVTTSIDIRPYAVTNFDETGKATILPEGEDTQEAVSSHAEPTSPNALSTDAYEAPASTYEKPTSTYKAPTSTYQAPTSTYGKSTSTYETPTSTYGKSTSTYEAPTSTYGKPTNTYGKSTSTYEAPTCTYEKPTSTYEAPTSTNGKPTSTHQAQSSTYEKPTNFYKAPTSTYGKSTNTYETRTSTHKKPPEPTNKPTPTKLNQPDKNNQSKIPTRHVIRSRQSSESIYVIYLSLFVIVILLAAFAYIIMQQKKTMTNLLNEKLDEADAKMKNMTENFRKKLNEAVFNMTVNLNQESRREEQERKNEISKETEERKKEINALNQRVDSANNKIADTESKINSLRSDLDKAVETSGWYKAKDNRYYRYFSRSVTYSVAKSLCGLMGARLAAHGIRYYRSELANYVMAPDATEVWIGLDDIQTEGSWVWSDGWRSGIPWSPGKPDKTRQDRNCAIASSSTWKIHDIECTNNYPFICEKS